VQVRALWVPVVVQPLPWVTDLAKATHLLLEKQRAWEMRQHRAQPLPLGWATVQQLQAQPVPDWPLAMQPARLRRALGPVLALQRATVLEPWRPAARRPWFGS
jgi:hypothetical protein